MKAKFAQTIRKHMRDTAWFSAANVWTDADAHLADCLLAFWKVNGTLDEGMVAIAFQKEWGTQFDSVDVVRVWARLQQYPFNFELAALRGQLASLNVDGSKKQIAYAAQLVDTQLRIGSFRLKVTELENFSAGYHISLELMQFWLLMTRSLLPSDCFVYSPFLLKTQKVSLLLPKHGQQQKAERLANVAIFPHLLNKPRAWVFFVSYYSKSLSVYKDAGVQDYDLRFAYAHMHKIFNCKSCAKSLAQGVQGDVAALLSIFEVASGETVNGKKFCELLLQVSADLLSAAASCVAGDLQVERAKLESVDRLKSFLGGYMPRGAVLRSLQCKRTAQGSMSIEIGDASQNSELASLEASNAGDTSTDMLRADGQHPFKRLRSASLIGSSLKRPRPNTCQQAGSGPGVTQDVHSDRQCDMKSVQTQSDKENDQIDSKAETSSSVVQKIGKRLRIGCLGEQQALSGSEGKLSNRDLEAQAQAELNAWVAAKYENAYLALVPDAARRAKLSEIRFRIMRERGLQARTEQPHVFSGQGVILGGRRPAEIVHDTDKWPDRALKIHKKWVSKILSGTKTWEIRSRRVKPMHVALAATGDNLLFGDVEIVACHSLEPTELQQHFGKHQIEVNELKEFTSRYKQIFAWELKSVRAYVEPVAFCNPKGAVVFVVLNDVAELFQNTKIATKVQSVKMKPLLSTATCTTSSVEDVEPTGASIQGCAHGVLSIAMLQGIDIGDVTDDRHYDAGLLNGGNTCFLNAMLVNLSSAFHFVAHMRAHLQAHSASSDDTGTCVRCLLARDLSILAVNCRRDPFLPEIASNMHVWGPRMHTGAQHCAGEAFLDLMNRVHEDDFNSVVHLIAPSQAMRCWNSTCAAEHFRVHWDVDKQCTSCNAVSHLQEHNFGLQLDLPIEDVTLEELMAGHFSLTNPQDFKCDCGSTGTCLFSKKVRMWPTVLVLHLKRFTVAGDKDARFVLFPELLIVDETSYSLQAIVVHMGDTLHFGHYVAFARDCCNAWVHLNDGDDPVQVSWDVVERQEAYLLTYQKV